MSKRHERQQVGEYIVEVVGRPELRQTFMRRNLAHSRAKFLRRFHECEVTVRDCEARTTTTYPMPAGRPDRIEEVKDAS